MYPVLVVEGVAHKVRTVEFDDEGKATAVSYFEGDEYKHVIDVQKQFNLTGSEVMDLSHALIWTNRYQPIIEALHKRIEAHEERMIELAVDAMENDLLFTDNRVEYMSLKDHVEGLHEALGIVSQGGYMEEDVDLSGGDEVAID